MPDRFPYDVFMSHNHTDKLRVALEPSNAVHRNPASASRRFIPLLLGDCALLDTLRRYKVVDFHEKSEAAFAEALATDQAETRAMKSHFAFPHGTRRARQSNATTHRLAAMSLSLRDIEADFSPRCRTARPVCRVRGLPRQIVRSL